MRPARARAIVALFFVSGVAGLLYELLWSRWLGLTFGNTVQSAAIVAGTFTAGLGVGALFGGRFADARPGRAVRAYAACELGVAAFGALLAFLLPRLPEAAAAFTSYARAADGFFEPSFGSSLLRALASMMLVAIPSALMGATLPLLLRALVEGHTDGAGGDVGVRAGLLYGANTLGGACGALLCDLVLVPRIGMTATVVVAVALDVVVGAGALLLARSRAPAPAAPNTQPPAASVDADVDSDVDRRVLACVLAALFLGGIAFLGAEVAWVRLLISALGATPAVVAVVLAVVLVGIAAGAAAGGALTKRTDPLALLCITEALFAAALSAGFVLPDPGAVAASFGGGLLVGPLAATMAVAFAASFFGGASYPVANAIVQRASAGDVGQRAGLITFAITVGDVVGAVGAAFVLLPAVGTQGTALACAGLAALAVAILVAGTRTRTRAALGGLALAFAACALFSFAPRDLVESRLLSHGPSDVLDVSEGPNETVVVGRRHDGALALYTNGHVMSAVSGSARRYMTMFADVPLLLKDDAKDVLVICFGVGNTAHAAALVPSVERIDVADLSRNVLAHAHFFASGNGDVLSDPRVHVYVNDGRNHLWSQPEHTYDLVTLEPPPIADAGVSSLYTREFYALAASRLKDGGYVTQWLPAYQVSTDDNLRIVRAFLDVFPDAVLLTGYFRDFILIGKKGGPVTLDPDAWRARMHANPNVEAQAAPLAFADPLDLASSIVGDSATLARATANIDAVRDDRPLFAQGSTTLAQPLIPASLFDPDRAPLVVCPACASLPHLAPLLEANRRMLASPAFLSGDPHYFLAPDPAIEEGVAASKLLTTAFPTPERAERRRAFVAASTPVPAP